MNDKHHKLQEDYFDSEAIGLKTDSVFPMKTLSAKMEFKSFKKFVGVEPGNKIVEIGCGIGRYTLPFLQAGIDVVGVDISGESLSVLEQAYQKFRRPNWGKLETSKEIPKQANADGVVCVNLLHHVENIPNKLKKMRNCVKTNGVVVAFEPNPMYFPWYLYFLAKGILVVEKGILKCSTTAMSKYFQQAHLQDITIRRYGILPTRLFNNNARSLYFSTHKLANAYFFKYFSFHYMIKGSRKA
ncbi:class I SAM-dependent methyltransferase [Patescibacteria group bacterium]